MAIKKFVSFESDSKTTMSITEFLLSALFGEIFGFEIFTCPPSWIFVDMYRSQLGSRNLFFSQHND